MSTYKWQRREAKKNGLKRRMPKHGRSLLTVIEPIQKKKAEAHRQTCRNCKTAISRKLARRNKGLCLSCSAGRD